jgi:hypothetical protein
MLYICESIMTNIKAYVPDYDELLQWSETQIVKRYRNVEILIGNSDSIKHIKEVLSKHLKK